MEEMWIFFTKNGTYMTFDDVDDILPQQNAAIR